MDLQLKNKKALVFASRSGIGKACAQALIQEGVQVIINGRDQEQLEKTAKEIGASGFIVGDLTCEGQAKRITEQALGEFKNLHIIVTNTGGPPKSNFFNTGLEQWKKDYQSLWLSVVESLQIALPKMKEQQYGRIIMVSSIAARRPLPELTTSNGLRSGLEGLARSIAQEVSSQGITLNLLLPGYTNTERLQNLNLSSEKIAQLIPRGHLAEPQELASLACYLASPWAASITGQSIAIDGGVLI